MLLSALNISLFIASESYSDIKFRLFRCLCSAGVTVRALSAQRSSHISACKFTTKFSYMQYLHDFFYKKIHYLCFLLLNAIILLLPIPTYGILNCHYFFSTLSLLYLITNT